MAIFGLKSRKSYSSDISSYSKPASDPNKGNHSAEASDVIGDSPDFGVLNSRRGPSNNSDSASLRSRSSMKKFFGSTRRKGSQSIDSGASPKPNRLQATDYANGATSRTSLHKTSNTVTTSAAAPTLSTPTEDGSSFADAVSASVSGGLAATTPTGPRPSELFAGKGVQWEQIDLTSRNLAKPVDAPATNVDMQKFLKERRQWIPTFKDSNIGEEEVINLPKKLDEFSFETPTEVSKSSAGLKSLKDLEDSHKRKAALPTPAPLSTAPNGPIFEEAGTSTSVIGSTSETIATGKSGQSLPPPPAAPSRNQSFRISTFATSNDGDLLKSLSLSRRNNASLGVNGSEAGASSTSGASQDIPQRKSSVRKELSEMGPKTVQEAPAASSANAEPATKTNGSEEVAKATNSRVDQIKEQAAAAELAPAAAGAGAATGTSTATGSVRPSMEEAGFATPTGSQSHESEHAPHAGSTPVSIPATIPEGSQDSSTKVAPSSPIGDAPSRPAKNEQRPPSRQSSKEPIDITKSTTSTLAATEENSSDKVAQAAPSLQNVVPGTGAATGPPPA